MEKTFSKRLAGAALRFRIMAWVTGVVLAIAFLWMVALWVMWMSQGNGALTFFTDNHDKPAAYGVLWVIHGWLYFIYLITGVDLSFRMRYGIGKTVLILLAGTIPFMSFFADNVTHKDVQARIAAQSEI